MKRILVGYDGSEPARHALAQASDQAKAFGCPLTVLTAAAALLVRADGVEVPAIDEARSLELAEEGARVAREAGVAQVDVRTSVDSADDAIVQATQEGYDFVVIGHRGHGGIREWFLGSTAKSVVDRVECSVLVVR